MSSAAAPRDLSISRALSVGWWVLMAALPIGHITGFRNAWTVLIALATLIWVGRDAWLHLPARLPLLALLAWCALSIGWSTQPVVSFGKWRSDLFVPLLAYAAAFGYVRRSGSIGAIAGGLVTGLAILAIVSAFAFVGPDDFSGVRGVLRFETFPNIDRPMPIWYPGVGDASMTASLAAGLLIFLRTIWSAALRWVVYVAWGALALIVLVANNRNAVIGIPLVALISVGLLRWRRRVAAGTGVQAAHAVRPPILAALVLALTVLVGIRLEDGARDRLEALKVPVVAGESAFVTLTARDTRPMIWRYYGRLALDSPWVGVGFGRTVPGMHFHTEDDRELARVESNAYSHAHNLFLNWWLQTGVVGVVLLVVALATIVRTALRSSASASARGPVACAAGFAIAAIVALMLIRDATDDFLVYGMATMFWALLGGLAALGSGAAVNARRGP